MKLIVTLLVALTLFGIATYGGRVTGYVRAELRLREYRRAWLRIEEALAA